MATTVVEPRMARPVVPEPRKARPVLWWAALGGFFVALSVYVFARWIGELPPRIQPGPTEVPAYMLWNIRLQEVLLPLLVLVVLSKWLFLPLLRRQKVPWDGIAATALMTCLWQDYLADWFQVTSMYNAVVINWGSWYQHVPGWLPPNATRGFPEAIVWDQGFYGNWILLCMWYCFMMRLAKRRWPQLGKVGVFGVAVACACFMDVALEFLWMRGGLYHYAGAYGPVFFKGHYYQFPIYEMVFFGLCMAAVASVRYFRNDKGESVAERGIDDVRVGTRAKGWIRWLALVGIFNLLFLAYNLSFAIVGLHSNDWPEDITKRSYFVSGICGANTDRACPGPAVPIPRPGSSYMDRDGNMAHESAEFTRNWSGPPPRKVEFER